MSIVRRALTAALTAFALVLLGWGAAPLAHAADPVTVTGSVVDAGSNPLAEVDVSLCLLSDGDVDCGEASATTSPTGEFTFDMANLAEGRTYTIRFSRASFFTTWLGGTTEQPTTPTPANSVGRSATSVHLEPLTLAQQFTLKGTLRTQSDLPIADVLVGLFPDDSDLSGGAALAGDNTNADGSFSIQIPADADTTDYVLATNDEEGVFAQHKETVTLSQADKDLGTIVLAGSLSVASGTVTDLGGNPIPDVSVTSMIWDGDSFSGYGYTSTGADGSYTVKVKAGKRFTVRYDQSKFSTEYLGGGHTRPTQEEDPVATRLAAPVDEPNAPLPTTVLDRMWQVSGRLVVVSAGDGVDNASVAAYAPNHSAGDESVDTASSDSNGDFSLSLPPGSYDLVIQTDEANPAVAGTTLAAVQVGDDTDLGEVALTALGNPVTGRITSASGPVAGARITSYLWSPDNSEWTSGVSAFSGADGTYVLPVKDGATFTVRARGNGFQTGWLGSGLVKPSEPEPNASAVSAPGLSIGDLNLFPTSDKVGKVAGQDLGYCSAHTLRANDDQSTGQVRLPFALKYFGQPYSSLFVNNNGNVTFGRPLSKYTPGDLTSADQDAPMIAPFFADVDTRNDASWEVTYGASADGKTFCVNWSTVGYFGRKADKLNIFQLLLSTRSSSVGRTDGDFDITMNYDQIQWETGDASDGTGGEGGTSAAVGYTAGTGDVGTFFELAGSRLPGSFLDQGPTALVSHQLNSSQVGRYLFQIRN